ncbi:MAG TPA: FtsH protease activity modulator HflK [Dehalococcoidia bacterium]|nr:FtsH protease activity modulator HflK [Dehalococcoidia bacterium]
MFQPGGGPRQPELDFEKIMGGIRDGIGRVSQRLGGGGVGLAVALFVGLIIVIWGATGVYTTSPGEQAVLRLFGDAQDTPVTQNGLHWWWPGPIGNKDVVRTDLVRRLELGFRSADGVANTPVPVEAQMISGDLNIIDVQMVVQYDIKNLSYYLFKVDDPGEDAGEQRNIPAGRPDGRTLKDATEAALRLVVGQRSLAEVLAEERVNLELDTGVKLQEILDGYQTGINIISVQLQKVEAPAEVQAAFNDVLQARQDKVTATNQAQAYENQVIPEARGRAEQIIQPAEAFKRARIERAQGEADQFLSILAQFNDRSITLQNVLQDTDNADGDDDPATGIGLSDVSMISAPDEDGDGFDILISAINVLGAGECAFTANQVLSTDATEICAFSASFDAQSGDLTIGESFSIAYLGNEDLTIPQFVGAGPFNVRLSNKALDADIEVVDGPDGGAVSGVDISVSGFDASTNIVTLRVQSGEALQAGDQFTVQYMNREDLTVPSTSLVTQERLYLEAMEEILPGINKIIVSPEAESVLILGGQGGIVPVPLGPAAP